MSRAATGVKMRSNGQGTFWGSVKRSSSVLGHYLRHYWRSRGVVDPFAHAQLIDGQGSRAKIQRGQAVKVVFRRSKILTPVAALDTAPIGVTPPCSYSTVQPAMRQYSAVCSSRNVELSRKHERIIRNVCLVSKLYMPVLYY